MVPKKGFGVAVRGALEPRPRNALGKAQPHHQHLLDRTVAVDRGELFDPGSGSLDRREPALGQAALSCRVFYVANRQPPMRTRADPDIILVAPIGEVVPAFGTRPRM